MRIDDLPGPLGTAASELTRLPADEAVRYLEDLLPHQVSETATERAHRLVLREAISALTADFRTIMGVPPAAYLHGRLPAPTRCRLPR
ncbi:MULTISPECIES: hypothetical protein [unclassified Nocardia]|uniref:hypothetical protein n=1 Tax=unclassified Nocardia TaxID=2637762 RepID=UPI0033BA0360